MSNKDIYMSSIGSFVIEIVNLIVLQE